MSLHSPQQITWDWEVPPSLAEDESRADQAVLQALLNSKEKAEGEIPSLSRNQIKRMIEEGQVRVNGKSIKASARLKPGDRVQISFRPPTPSELIAEDRPLSILYEDDDLVIINKPQGLTVHPSPTQMSGTLVHALLHHIKDLSGIGGVLRPGIVHRIDKNTSGAMVVTKTDLAHQRLSEVFSRHEIERCYWALCYGAPRPSKSEIESLIGRSPSNRKKMSMKVTSGKIAKTFYRTEEEYAHRGQSPFASWLSVTLTTGRTHQIRVHLTGIGNSILGDPVYGKPTTQQPKWKSLPAEVQAWVDQLPGQALHARVLGFKHPITGKSIRVEADPPPLFQSLLTCLQSFSSVD